jgi:hypothetical protein
MSIPFVNNGPCTDVRYILFMATTNESPGTGSTNDDLFLDDVLLVYNPTLSMGQLASTSFTPGDAITIPFSFNRSASLVSCPAFKPGATYCIKTQGYEKTFSFTENFTIVR